MNAAQNKIINLLKTLWDFFVILCHDVFNVWPKTTLLPVWKRDAKKLGTPANVRGNWLSEVTWLNSTGRQVTRHQMDTAGNLTFISLLFSTCCQSLLLFLCIVLFVVLPSSLCHSHSPQLNRLWPHSPHRSSSFNHSTKLILKASAEIMFLFLFFSFFFLGMVLWLAHPAHSLKCITFLWIPRWLVSQNKSHMCCLIWVKNWKLCTY